MCEATSSQGGEMISFEREDIRYTLYVRMEDAEPDGGSEAWHLWPANPDDVRRALKVTEASRSLRDRALERAERSYDHSPVDSQAILQRANEFYGFLAGTAAPVSDSEPTI